MCDEKSFSDMIEYTVRTRGLSRREFGALTLGASVTFALPTVANAAQTTESEVKIKTPDGTADAYFVHPPAGKHLECSSGRISSACVLLFGRWASAWRSPVTPCW